MTSGNVIILNGVPRSGKSSIADEIIAQAPGEWIALGVDQTMAETPANMQPGIGLRPGGERPDLEGYVLQSYLTLYASIADHARRGANVVVDVGHHDDYSRSLGIWAKCAQILAGLPVTLVGVMCPIDHIMNRRNAGDAGYVQGTKDDPIPAPVQRWQDSVHKDMAYDLAVDTSQMSPTGCAKAIIAFISRS